MTRLKHYEKLLKKNGIDPNFFEDDVSVGDGLETASDPDSSSLSDQIAKGQFLSREGRSIYFDKLVLLYRFFFSSL